MSASQIGFPDTIEETPQDAIYTVGDIRECPVNDPPSDRWNPVIERYICGDLSLDLTPRKRPGRDPYESVTTQYRVFLYWPSFQAFNREGGESLQGFWKREVVLPDKHPRKLEGAMLVGVREFVEMPERTFPTLSCSAVCFRERLFGSDHIDVGCINPWKESLHPVAHKSTLIHEDRELAPSFDKLKVLPVEQLTRQVIETAPEVVNNFSDHHTPHWIGFALNSNPDNELFRLSVELTDWYIRVAINEGCQLLLESVKLAPGSFSFEPYPV